MLSHVEVIPWTEFQRLIAPLWGVEVPETIPILNNPYRVIAYPLDSWPTEILHYPVTYYEDGVPVGHTCFYNVSPTTVRVRGIYVLPEHRGHGVGHRMLRAGMGLFPPGFFRLIGFFRETNVERYVRCSGMQTIPGTDWFWSTYQNIRIRALYWDRERGVTPSGYVEGTIDKHGLGGQNNLDRTWTAEEWLEFASPHATAYPDGQIDLDF